MFAEDCLEAEEPDVCQLKNRRRGCRDQKADLGSSRRVNRRALQMWKDPE